MSRTFALSAVAVVAAGMVSLPSTEAVGVTAGSKYRSCAQLNRDYPHGVGRKGAKDKTRGRTAPVRNFRVDSRLYASLPKTLDRDKDGIACEKGGQTTPTKKPTPKKPLPTKPSTSGRSIITRSGFAFVTPSGNIGCAAGTDEVRCDARSFTYRPPKRPAWCDLDFGGAFGLDRTAQMLCVGDTVGGTANLSDNPWYRATGAKPLGSGADAQAVLPYGWTLRSGRIACTSATTGVTCTNSTTGHGFMVSKAAYRMF